MVRKAAVWAIAAQYVAFGVQFITSVVLARYFIAPAELGVFSIAFAAVSLIAFLQDFGIARYVSGERDLDDAKLRTAFTISLTVGWLIAAAAVCLAWPLSSFYGDPRLVSITLVIAGSYFLVPLAIVPQALRQRELDFRSSAMIDMSAAIANGAVALTLAWRGHGALALAWGAFAQQVARMLVAQWRAGWIAPWPPRVASPGKVLGFGGTNSVLVTCALVVARAPELFVGRLIGTAAVGHFARATGLAMQLRMLLAGAVSSVFYPAFRQARDRGDKLGPPYLRVIAAYSAITWPAMAGVAVLSQPLVAFLYGPLWAETAPLLVWIALAQMCFVAFPLNADLPILLDRKGELIRRNLIDLLLAVILLMIAIPYGLTAVAASRLVHGLTWMINFGFFLKSVVGFSWRDLLAIQLRSLAVTGLAIAPSLFFYRVWNGPADAGIVQMLSGVAAGIALWLIGLRQLRHPAYGEIFWLAGSAIGLIPGYKKLSAAR